MQVQSDSSMCSSPDPTRKALAINLRLSSDTETFVDKHRLGMTNRRKTCENVLRNVYAFRLSFHFCMPLSVVGEEQDGGGGDQWRSW